MGTPNSIIQPLQNIQNFAARLVFLAPRHHHSAPLLEKLHWLPVSEYVKYNFLKSRLYVFHCCKRFWSCLPRWIATCPSRTLRSSSDTCMLKIQQYKRKTPGFRIYFYFLFFCFGPHIWNLLPQDFRHCSTLSSIKTKLKPSSFHSNSAPSNISTTFHYSVCVCVHTGPERQCRINRRDLISSRKTYFER